MNTDLEPVVDGAGGYGAMAVSDDGVCGAGGKGAAGTSDTDVRADGWLLTVREAISVKRPPAASGGEANRRTSPATAVAGRFADATFLFCPSVGAFTTSSGSV
jgi:hypothetical protein